MTRLVVDSSVCLKWIFQEADSERARNLLSRYERGEALLFVPGIWEYEVMNALATATIRKKIDMTTSRKFLRYLIKASPNIISMGNLLPVCLENCQRYQISGYDSAYVTLAITNKDVLISSDDRLVAKINNPKIAVALREFS